jgi:phage host-nuclease inhibitor protein Gam
MAQKHVAEDPAIRDWAGADEALAEIRQEEQFVAAREADKAGELQGIQAHYDGVIQPALQRRDALAKALEEFVGFRRGELGPGKSRDLNHGRVGFRLGQPALKTLARWTWAKVLECLIHQRARTYIRVRHEVDREALIRSGLDNEALKGFGVRVAQEERFYYELVERETVSVAGGTEEAAK